MNWKAPTGHQQSRIEAALHRKGRTESYSFLSYTFFPTRTPHDK